MKKSDNKKSIPNILLKIVLFIVLALVMALIINYFTKDDSPNDSTGLDPNATQEQEEENSETNDEIAIPGFEKLVFEAESLTQDVAFENPEQNDVYFIISLSIEDELVYESQLVEPGKGIYSIELPQTYPAGEYEGTLSYETRSMADTNERKNGASMNTPIVFE